MLITAIAARLFTQEDHDNVTVQDLIDGFIAELKIPADKTKKISAELEKFTQEYMRVWKLRDGKGIAKNQESRNYRVSDGLLHKDNPLFDPNLYDPTDEVKRVVGLGQLNFDKPYFDLVRSANLLADNIAECDAMYYKGKPRGSIQMATIEATDAKLRNSLLNSTNVAAN